MEIVIVSTAKTAARSTFEVRVHRPCTHVRADDPDFRAVAKYEKTVHDHRTGRKCARCGGLLHDSIINFGEALPAQPMRRARACAKKADLCLVLGSSLTVTPANEIPETVGERRGGKLVICNLQKTPIDHLSDLRIHSEADILMTRVMEKLNLIIPKFILHRRLLIKVASTGVEKYRLTALGVDVDGTPITFLKSVKLDYNRRIVRNEPFAIDFRGNPDPGTVFKLELEFMGHYGEPNLEIKYHLPGDPNTEKLYMLEYNPQTGVWNTSQQDSNGSGEGANGDIEKEEDSALLSTDVEGVPNNVKPTSAANVMPEIIDLT